MSPSLRLHAAALCFALTTACGVEAPEELTSQTTHEEQALVEEPSLPHEQALRECQNHRDARTYDPHSRVFGRRLDTWSEDLWRWVYAAPLANNPILDPTGEDRGFNQQGPVWFLAATAGMMGPNNNRVRTCTVPQRKPVLVQLGGIVNDFPCPDPAFKPAEGQLMYQFLLAGARAMPDMLKGLSFSIDGVKVKHIFDYRATSDSLFTFVGDPSLTATFDGCITGTRQIGVADTFAVMLRPLAVGNHTLVITATDAQGMTGTASWNLTVQ